MPRRTDAKANRALRNDATPMKRRFVSAKNNLEATLVSVTEKYVKSVNHHMY